MFDNTNLNQVLELNETNCIIIFIIEKIKKKF